jgi:hypothetical protein
VPELPLRQIVYHSVACGRIDTASILEQSRHNNALDGLTGVLWLRNRHFVQVLEGHALSVAETFARISRDPRHEDITILSDQEIETREFGYWSMEDATTSGFDTHIATRLKRSIFCLPHGIQRILLDHVVS